MHLASHSKTSTTSCASRIMRKLLDILGEWWGLAVPIASFAYSVLGMPDAPYWFRWVLLAVSAISYAVGRFNRLYLRRRTLMRRIRRLDADKRDMVDTLCREGIVYSDQWSKEHVLLEGLMNLGFAAIASEDYLAVKWKPTRACLDAMEHIERKERP